MSSPYFSGTPKSSTAVVSTANTNRDGTGTLADLLTAGSSGSLVNGVTFHATGTVADGMIRIFHYDGTNNRLIGELKVTAATPDANVEAWSGEWAPRFPLFIPATTGKLKASTHNGDTFHACTSHGDL